MVGNAYSRIPSELTWKEGLAYGLKNLRWGAEHTDKLETNTLWVIHHQLKNDLLFQSDDSDCCFGDSSNH